MNGFDTQATQPKVYVKNKNGNPLMPCKPAKARKLLRDGKAKVVNRCPFTIKLQWDCEENMFATLSSLLRKPPRSHCWY